METNLESHVAEESEIPFKDDSDICHQLLSRYSTSKAPHHRHLLATAAAIRSILTSESLPLSPAAYFVAAIDNLSDSESLDSNAIAALLSFVSIVVPLIPNNGIKGDKASEAVKVLVGVAERDGLGAASVSGLVKCLGVLIVGFCDLEDWGSVKEGFETVLKFSIDKRPKVHILGYLIYLSSSRVVNDNGFDLLAFLENLVLLFLASGQEERSRLP